MALGSGSFAQFVSWRNVVAKRDSVIDAMYIISLNFSRNCYMEKYRRYVWLIHAKIKAQSCVASDL